MFSGEEGYGTFAGVLADKIDQHYSQQDRESLREGVEKKALCQFSHSP